MDPLPQTKQMTETEASKTSLTDSQKQGDSEVVVSVIPSQFKDHRVFAAHHRPQNEPGCSLHNQSLCHRCLSVWKKGRSQKEKSFKGNFVL
ncbi:hypothetical protein AMECASPLE_029712 [Ameca splendens]|uniref:Uncharacterized protein n=1 Tax=Ameca splendens TaxID=208324 RepID=A0ABV0XIT3_9TELE